jgi:co-chaperonin GroES (HSP10)|tara:strand:- start:977 stop:1360 length:384 start_codon:yes stop_codon:yes gene_type:complete
MSEAIQYSNEVPESLEGGKQLPEPTGFRLLIALPEVQETTEAGLYIPGERRDAESVASIVGFVMKSGPDAYADNTRFPNGPWCRNGDWIVMRAYSGTRLKIRGKEFRIINDDSVEAVVDDPRGVVRA